MDENRELEQGLARLGLDRDGWRAISLLPLIEVAWADGRVQDAERKLLEEVARGYGIGADHPFLKRWLKKRPPRADFLRARTLLLRLWRRAGPQEVKQPETLEQLLDLCLRVAEAAGGLFGILFTVEASEREAMAEIAASLQLGPELPETVAQSWRTPRTELSPPAGGRRARSAPSESSLAKTALLRLPPSKNPVADETTKIRPVRGSGKRKPKLPDHDPDATTRITAPPRPFGVDDEATSPYLDFHGGEDGDADLDD